MSTKEQLNIFQTVPSGTAVNNHLSVLNSPLLTVSANVGIICYYWTISSLSIFIKFCGTDTSP